MFSNFLFTFFLEDGEDIMLVCHKHIWTHRKTLTKEFLLGVALPVVFFFVYPPLVMLWGVWLLIGFFRFVYAIADWYYDSWLVTNMGIIDVEWNGFFDRQSSRIEYHTIDGICYQIKGFYQTIFNYGDVQLQQIGGAIIVDLKDAVDPRNVERQIIKIQDQVVTAKNRREHEALKDILAGLVQSSIKK